MKNEYIPYGKQTITQEDIDSVVKVLKSDFLTQGPVIDQFENEISKFVKSKFSVAFNSATSALHMACLALGLQEGDYLWTSPITFVASANCGLYCQAKIDFVDIDPMNGLMDVNKLKEKLEIAKKDNKLPKVLVPVHLAGTSCDMPEIYNLSKKYGFSIIEDASHAIGGYCNNIEVGSCKYSDITVFSLHPVKIITSGEGGIATTNDKQISNKLKSLRSHGIIKDKQFFKNSSKGDWYYEQQFLGYNYRMNDISAALGLSQLKKIKSFIEKRTNIIEIYKRKLSNLPLSFLKVPSNIKSSYHLAIIRLDNKNPNHHEFVFRSLKTKNIGVQVHYIPVHLQPYYRQMGFSEGNFPNAESYSSNAISLPIYPNLSSSQIDRVIDHIKEILK